MGSRMRKILAAIAGVVLASSANAASVTFTLSFNESATGAVAPGQFAIYATVSKGDNDGLMAFGVDLLGSGQVGGPVGLTLISRTPNGTFDVDPTDPNFNPGEVYSTQFIGFSTGRGATASTGIISGVQDLPKGGQDAMNIYGAGQVVHAMNDFRPPPNTSSGVPVRYGGYVPTNAGTDNPIGNPFNRNGVMLLPEGSMRLATGTYDVGGPLPTFELGSPNLKASVWKLSHPNDTENEFASLSLCLRDFSGAQAMEIVPGQSCVAVPEPGIVLSVLGLVLMARGRRR